MLLPQPLLSYFQVGCQDLAAVMRLQSFLPIGAFPLSGEFVLAQSVSTKVSAPNPSGTFNAVAALAAYGVNVSDYSSSDSGSANSGCTSTSPSKSCSFSVSIIPLPNIVPAILIPKTTASARPSPYFTLVASRHKAAPRTIY
jgi:hypothetical protein